MGCSVGGSGGWRARLLAACALLGRKSRRRLAKQWRVHWNGLSNGSSNGCTVNHIINVLTMLTHPPMKKNQRNPTAWLANWGSAQPVRTGMNEFGIILVVF